MNPTIRPTKKQHEAWEALRQKDVVFFGGGAGGGKSWWLCETRLVNCYFYPGYKSFIGREELKRLMQSTFITWSKVCKFHDIPSSDWNLNSKYNYIEFFNGSRVDLLDLAYKPSDPLYERFGSLEYTDGAIEEAGEVHKLAYDVLKSRVGRHLNKEYSINPTIAITGNPKKNWTYTEFYKKWKDGSLPETMAFIQSLYKDNPYTAIEYGRQLQSIQDAQLRERLKNGNWEYLDDPTWLIESYDAVEDIFTNKVQRGQKYIICDVARFGSDKARITAWDGLVLIHHRSFDISKTTEISEYIKILQAKYGVPNRRTLVDSDGVGGGVMDEVGCVGFVNNARPITTWEYAEIDDPISFTSNFDNLKSQCGFKLADHINEALISVDCDLLEAEKEEIKEELLQLKRGHSDDRKNTLIKKSLMKESLGRSPDWLDVFIMRMYFELEDSVLTAEWE